jgi:DNA-binding CsgD family transcriptional regulator
MFDNLVAQLASRSVTVTRREEGVAFFGVAKDLYQLAKVIYFCANIPIVARSKHYTHCIYSDSVVWHYMSQHPLELDFVKEAGFCFDTISCEAEDQSRPAAILNEEVRNENQHVLTFRLRQRHGETAIFAVSAQMMTSEWQEQKKILVSECRILANYFHSHILRINGHNSEHEILMSARELDCLKWTAAGKTAWEASVILGISERTVRFHLNTAREKLNCATTTQAVAKAIVNQLIDI